jgi:hypothetical protein
MLLAISIQLNKYTLSGVTVRRHDVFPSRRGHVPEHLYASRCKVIGRIQEDLDGTNTGLDHDDIMLYIVN